MGDWQIEAPVLVCQSVFVREKSSWKGESLGLDRGGTEEVTEDNSFDFGHSTFFEPTVECTNFEI